MLSNERLEGITDVFSDIYNSIATALKQFFEGGLPWGTSNQEILDMLISQGFLRRGSRGNMVEALQIALCLLGYYPCSENWIDGIYGSKTFNAVKQFQTDYDLQYKDGIVGTETIGKLKDVLKEKGLLDDFINEVVKRGLINIPGLTSTPPPEPAPPSIPPPNGHNWQEFSLTKGLLIAGVIGTALYLLLYGVSYREFEKER